jgi:predicted Fe-Mo cluster-binding NifX family protein
MKVAISSSGDTLQSEVDSRFARCPYYVIYDTESENSEAIENKSVMAGGGAGVQSAQALSDIGVKAVISGNVGPSAFRVLSVASIEIYSGASGSIEEVIKKFKKGEYKKSNGPDVNSRFGTGGNN